MDVEIEDADIDWGDETETDKRGLSQGEEFKMRLSIWKIC